MASDAETAQLTSLEHPDKDFRDAFGEGGRPES
jgi:hypothetical protein